MKNKLNFIKNRINTKLLLSITFMFFLTAFTVHGQERTVSGTVSDAEGLLPGASIIIKGTSQGTQSDFDGKYTLENVSENAIIVFSYIGHKTQEINSGTSTSINVTLEEDTQSLDEVVIVGYGASTKRELTGSSSSIKASLISKRPLTQIDQALGGTVAGVVVRSETGQPGKGQRIKIRGTNSITGNTEPLYVVDGFIGTDFSGIDPNEIKSIEILKDAAATAIYGSRGSNGVVLITTKSGRSGAVKVDFNVWTSIGKIERRLDLLNAGDFARMVNIQDGQAGNTATFSDSELQTIANGPSTDWQEEIFRTAVAQNYSIAFSGGSETMKYRFSANHLDQPGTLLNQSYKRTSFRSNLDFKLHDKLDLKVNLTGYESESSNTDYNGDLGEPLGQALIWNPISPVRDENGDFITRTGLASIGFNPVAEALNRKNDLGQRNFSATTTLNWKITDKLTFTTTNAYNTFSNLRSQFFGLLTGSGNVNNNSRASHQENEGYSFLNSNYFTYKNTFGEHHNITVTALYEQQVNEGFNFNANALNLSTESLGYYNIGLAGSPQIGSNYTESSLESYMGRVNYSYKDKYLVSASYRVDGSSRLVDKYSGFPSVGLAWRLTEEDFLQDSNTFTDLKIRASYGETGNQAIAPFSSFANINVGNPVFFDGSTPTVTTPLGSPAPLDLRWEVTKQTDIGLDAVLFDGKVTLTADWYNKNITDLLFQRQVPAFAGRGNLATNLGELNNSGFEFSLGAEIVNNDKFTWNSDFNISFNENEVVNLEGQDNLRTGRINILNAGRSLGEFNGFEYLGTWKSSEAAEASAFGSVPGDAKYRDVNGDNAYTDADIVSIGNALPDFNFGFNTDLSYGNWRLNMLWQGTYGNDIYSQTLAFATGGLGQARNATLQDALNTWTPQNESNYAAYSPTSENFINSSRYVHDASYAKLKNLSVTYVFQDNLLSKIGASYAEVYLSGQNLITITSYPGLDPEVTSVRGPLLLGNDFNALPNPTTYTLGLKFGF